MNIAFYCPLKPPDHPNPSGDRRIARLLMQAMRVAGHRVVLASTFRTRDGSGNTLRQRRLCRLGEHLASRLVRRFQALSSGERPQIWFTYHAYYKAPDWLGPAVSSALDIPYVLAEASVAPKRAGGPWDCGHRGSVAAVRAADAVLSPNPDDDERVRPLLKPQGELVRLPPFVDARRLTEGVSRPAARDALSRARQIEPEFPWLVAVAMMRHGDKLESYRRLGITLRRLLDVRWTLLVVGDGPARQEVEDALAPLGADRVRFLGRQEGRQLRDSIGACDLLVWPAVNEAFGMSLLEAQALGLPVVAVGARGVTSVVAHGETGLLVGEGDAEAFAGAVRQMLAAPGMRRRMGAAARRRVLGNHDIHGAAETLNDLFSRLRGGGP